jgi:drug/metabolite transporter (DMT)-like permease
MQFSSKLGLGLLAAIATVTIWAAFLLVTRFAVQSDFTVEEVLVLRIVPGAIVMIPVMVKMGVVPSGQSWPRALMLMVGSSAVFPYVVSKGLAYAPASDGGALAPGMLPFWTALAAYFLIGEVPGPRRRLGLALILTGAIVVSLWQIYAGSDQDALQGHLMFLTGSGCFAIYSVIFRQSGLSPMHVIAIGLFWGTLLIIPLLLATGNVTFASTSLVDIAVMIVLQSLIIGILAMVLFGYAVQHLGAAETAAFGALTPILALIGGVTFLGESFTLLKVAGIGLVVVGVFLASGILGSPATRKPANPLPENN